MTLEHPTLALTTDSLCALFKLAVLPPEQVLKYAQIETLLGIERRGTMPTMQPLIDRGWGDGLVSKGYTLTPDGHAAVQSFIRLVNQTLVPTP